MKHKSLIQKVKDSLTEKPHAPKRTILHRISNKLLRRHISEKTGIQQISEQHKRMAEQNNINFFNTKTEPATKDNEANLAPLGR